ncbi:DUF4265 domain-containing protein [Pseudomonas sp. SWI6]|uniref:DUF4265 domain-containing protein n=1 Tax=Pseudomonas TaxID=286 RepID=UPI0003C078F8|nr:MULTISPECIES: DUF4265 domain-containing protein [Pseudomonas]AGZ36168.1 hypothetical protein PVLB_16925 [Pseudomonas sp. VLB120]AGZ37273.1 hypothetical protein PVLB_22470 [Pseudomonas sp. VLB120]AVD81413.1 DUF4265 domain-containing protein [Pseudomonas sp. SWI6]AVD88368.1 DUF4265 domain-containing protein [Pseudomonas sp. SWI44]MDT8927047.1 DUF4265 domain-containing protein [Pseudomonas taiwanensis]
MEKVFISLNVVDGYPPVGVESVWAEKKDGNLYRIKNIPFYSKEVCFEDEVSTSKGSDGEAVFVAVVADEGNSTIRIIFFDGDESVPGLIMAEISNMGCSWEGMSKKFFSVNVPREVDFDEVVKYLEVKSEEGWLDYEYGKVRQ